MLECRIEEGYVKGGRDFVRSFLGNSAWLEYFFNNMLIIR